MATQITNYQCPACMAPLRFDGVSGKLVCDYCDSVFDVGEIETLYAEKEKAAAEAFAEAEARETEQSDDPWDASDLTDDWGEDGVGMKAYNCPSCGAQMICDATTAATSCPYCGNPTVVPGQFSGGLRPDCVLPFRLDREAAKTALKAHYKGKRFLPNSFSDENKINEIKGVYVPFWLFDGEASADVSFDGRNIRRYTRGDYEITETDHYRIRRAGTVRFEKIPVDASTKMPDAYMDAIEPFDYSALQPFSSAYLPGFLADRYDVEAADCAGRAEVRAQNTAVQAMAADVGRYDICTPGGQSVSLRRGKVHYCLLPVYLLATEWKGKKYLFAMNGQTGKMVGDLPVDTGKYWKYFLGITAAVTAVLGTLLNLVL